MKYDLVYEKQYIFVVINNQWLLSTYCMLNARLERELSMVS